MAENNDDTAVVDADTALPDSLTPQERVSETEPITASETAGLDGRDWFSKLPAAEKAKLLDEDPDLKSAVTSREKDTRLTEERRLTRLHEAELKDYAARGQYVTDLQTIERKARDLAEDITPDDLATIVDRMRTGANLLWRDHYDELYSAAIDKHIPEEAQVPDGVARQLARATTLAERVDAQVARLEAALKEKWMMEGEKRGIEKLRLGHENDATARNGQERRETLRQPAAVSGSKATVSRSYVGLTSQERAALTPEQRDAMIAAYVSQRR